MQHTNPIGIHALVWTGAWGPADCHSALRRARETGFDLVEVPLLDPAGVDPEMTAEAAREHSLDLTFSLGLGASTDISSDDPEVVARGERLLRAALDVVRRAGAHYLGGVLYSAMTKYTRPATAQGREHAVGVLAGLAAAAAPDGITIGLEPVNRYESNVVNTAEQALVLIAEIGAPNVVVHLDTYHMHIEEADLAEPVRRCAGAGRLGYVHVGESHRGYLGSGSVDFARLFRALHEVDYGGPVVFESFSSAVVSEAFVGALAIWRDPWRDSLDLARHARSFIDSQRHAAACARLSAASERVDSNPLDA